jgi:hypothetical protein
LRTRTCFWPRRSCHRQIAARDHRGERTAARSFDDQLRQVLDAKPRLYLQHDRQRRTVRASAGQLAVEQRHVRWALHERKANQVGLRGDKVECEEIVLCERRQMELRIRKIDAFLRFQSRTPVRNATDCQFHLARLHRDDSGTNLAIG